MGKYAGKDMIGEAIMLGTWITIHLRVLAVNHDLKLPSFPGNAVYSKQTRPRDTAAELALEEDKERQSLIDSFRANPERMPTRRQSISDPGLPQRTALRLSDTSST